jgi:hypothetical protein
MFPMMALIDRIVEDLPCSASNSILFYALRVLFLFATHSP